MGHHTEDFALTPGQRSALLGTFTDPFQVAIDNRTADVRAQKPVPTVRRVNGDPQGVRSGPIAAESMAAHIEGTNRCSGGRPGRHHDRPRPRSVRRDPTACFQHIPSGARESDERYVGSDGLQYFKGLGGIRGLGRDLDVSAVVQRRAHLLAGGSVVIDDQDVDWLPPAAYLRIQTRTFPLPVCRRLPLSAVPDRLS